MRSATPLIALLAVAATLALAAPAEWPASGTREVEVRMPPFETPDVEQYLCTSAPLPGGGATPLRLTGVRPLSSATTVHHMLLFGA